MLTMVSPEFAKAFPGKMDQIPPPGMIKAALRFGPPRLAWLKHYLRNTLTAKDTGEKVILWVYWPLTQLLIEQVSTPSQSHLLPLISTLTFDSDTHPLWHVTVTSTLHMTLILTVCSTAASSARIVLLSITQWVPMRGPPWRSHSSTAGRWGSLSCPIWHAKRAWTYILTAEILSW